MGGRTQRWERVVGGELHRVEVEGSVSHTLRWYVDDELVASARSTGNAVTLRTDPPGPRSVRVRFTVLGVGRQVTLLERSGGPADAGGPGASPPGVALVGPDGLDLDPEPGSPGDRREQRIREHPWRHAAVATAGGAAKVVVPLLLGLVAVRFAVSLPWPDWDVPWPDVDVPGLPLPDVPWPDVDLPDWRPPGWLAWLLDHAHYVWPVLLAAVLARREVDRRRKQDALKAGLDDASRPAPHEPDEPDGPAGP